MDSIKYRFVKVMYFYLRDRFKLNDIFSFFSVCIFAKICSTESGSMKISNAKMFVMVGSRWRVGEGIYISANKLYICMA